MTDKVDPPPVTDPPAPPTDGPNDAQRGALKDIIKEALTEMAEDAKKAPERTKKPDNIWSTLFGG